MLFSHRFLFYYLNVPLSLFPKGSLSSLTPLGLTGKETGEEFSSWLLSVAFLMKPFFGYSSSTECQESRAFSLHMGKGGPPSEQSSAPVLAYVCHPLDQGWILFSTVRYTNNFAAEGWSVRGSFWFLHKLYCRFNLSSYSSFLPNNVWACQVTVVFFICLTHMRSDDSSSC